MFIARLYAYVTTFFYMEDKKASGTGSGSELIPVYSPVVQETRYELELAHFRGPGGGLGDGSLFVWSLSNCIKDNTYGEFCFSALACACSSPPPPT